MRTKTWLPILSLTTGLLLGASTTALTQTPPTQAPTQRPAGVARHPHIVAAGRALQHAARQLEEAAHDYGGHRVRALELVKQAEGELREAVAYANAHPDEFKAPK
jgi:uncharacterized protein YgbK (DUF1537 family)